MSQNQSPVKEPETGYAQADLDELMRALRAVDVLVTSASWGSVTERSALLIELRNTAAACARLHEAMVPGRCVRSNPYTGEKAIAWYAGHASGYARGTFDRESVGDKLEQLRNAGWVVAVHNDYRQSGRPMTFWLFTRAQDGGVNMEAVKGEGATDAEALEQALERAGLS